MSAYGILISFSILISSLVAEKLTPKKDRNILWGLVFWSVLCGIVGARMYHVAHLFPYYINSPGQILAIWNGGLGIWGGIIGGMLGATIYLKRKKQKIMPWLNLVGVVLPLGQFLGRLGNFFNQEIFGPPTNLPWGIFIKLENRPSEYISFNKFHPLFLYEGILNLTLFLILLNLWKKEKKESIFWLYLSGYSIIRFFTEYLKTDPWTIFGLNVSQGISILVLLVSFLFIKLRKAK